VNGFFESIAPNVVKYWDKFEAATVETLQMVFISLLFIVVLGIALGLVLVVITPGHLYGNRALNAVVPRLVNLLRSIPFVLLIALILPFTRLLVGTAIGVKGAIVPIVIAMIPFVARQVEQAVFELDKGVIEMALSLGLSRIYILFRIILKEARTGITRIIILSSISVVGYSTMAGVVGGGGIGDLAIRYGYARFMGDITIASVILLLILVFSLQGIGNIVLKRLSH
jgi:D-methionine transport system permease protein